MARNSVMDRVMAGVGAVEIRRNSVGRPAEPDDGSGQVAQYSANVAYRHLYKMKLGFESVVPVLPGADVLIQVHPVTPFEPQRLFIPSDIAYDFALVSMQLQAKSFIDGTPVNCAMFSEVALQEELEIGTIDVQDTLRMVFRNTSVLAQLLVGGFHGNKLSR